MLYSFFGWFPGIWILWANLLEHPEYPNVLILVILPAYTAYEDGTECFETLAHEIQTLGNRPKERVQHSEHGESLKSRRISDVNDNIHFTECLFICQIIYVKFKFSILDASFTWGSCKVFLKLYSVITFKATYMNYGICGLNWTLSGKSVLVSTSPL